MLKFNTTDRYISGQSGVRTIVAGAVNGEVSERKGRGGGKKTTAW